MTMLDKDFPLLEEKAEFLRTMGHPIRLAIVELLARRSKLTVTEIYRALRIEQAVASHHLRIMRSTGVVKSVKDGKHVIYTLSHSKIKTIYRLLFEF